MKVVLGISRMRVTEGCMLQGKSGLLYRTCYGAVEERCMERFRILQRFRGGVVQEGHI